MMDLLARLRGQMGQEQPAADPMWFFQQAQQAPAAPMMTQTQQAPIRVPVMPFQEQAPMEEAPIPVSNVANYIEESLGSREAATDDGFVKNILSGRFTDNSVGPSFSDYGQQIAQAAGGKIVSPQAFADERLSNSFSTMAQMAKIQQAGQGTLPKGYRFKQDGTAEMIPGVDLSALNSNAGGGATGALVQGLMAENPNLSFEQALYQVQTGFRRGTQLDDKGNVVVTPGTLQAAGANKFAENRGKGAADLTIENENASLAIDGINYGVQNAQNILKSAKFTGRGLSKIGQLVGDPDFDQLKSQINRLIPQLRVASKFPAAGFSDADAARLESAIGNPNMTLEGLNRVFNDVINEGQARQQQFATQNQAYGSEFGYGVPAPIPSMAAPPAPLRTKVLGGKTYMEFAPGRWRAQ